VAKRWLHRLIGRRDPAVVDQLIAAYFHAHALRVYDEVVDYGTSAVEAEALTLEAFSLLYGALASDQWIKRPYTWLVRTARNLIEARGIPPRRAVLSPFQRECLHLRAQGMRLRKIARRTGADERAVALAVQEAVKAMKEMAAPDR
jgi:DNA-directed RNA polymerase specialized sigma24 family protein